MNDEFPWNAGVEGDEVLNLINGDAAALRVEAGPGTGKTFGLVRRVVRLLHHEGAAERPQDVLVVAFNRVIAKDLKREIAAGLNEAGIADEMPQIMTVHALCLRTLGEDLRLLLPHEREMMTYDVRHAYSEIRESYQDYNATDQALRNHEAGHERHEFLWRAVHQWLDEHGAAVISDLPDRLLAHLRAGDFETERYRHILVDEFQDLTAAEQELFRRMRADGGQFLALGDARQSIYAFRGNDRMGLRRLDEWATAEGIELEDVALRTCRRCPAAVVAAANSLMQLHPAEAMLSVRNDPAAVHLIHWNSPRQETAGMAARILEHVRITPEADRHLAMVTRRQFGFALREKLLELDAELNVDIAFEEGILDTWPAREAFLFFCLLVDADPATWRAWLGYQMPDAGGSWKPPQRNAAAYRNLFDGSGGTITREVIMELANEPRTRRRGAGGVIVWDRAVRLCELLEHFSESATTGGEAMMNAVFATEHSPFLVSDGDDDTAELDLSLLREKALQAFQDLQSEEVADDDLLPLVARSLRHKIATREPFDPGTEADIRITTLWGGKGVTADYVYVLGLCDAAIPGTKRDEYPGTGADHIDEQRRLFYVSLTRAKRTLVLSRPAWIRAGDARPLGFTVSGNTNPMRLRMSRFFRDILAHLPESIRGDDWAGIGGE